MAPHSSILAWRIPWTEEAGGLQSMGSNRVRALRIHLLLSSSHHLLAQVTPPSLEEARNLLTGLPASLQSVFTRLLPWARPCSPRWGYSNKQKLAEIPVLMELAF